MVVSPSIVNRAAELTEMEQKRIERTLDSLARRLEKFNKPEIDLTLDKAKLAGSVDATLKVVLGVRDTTLRSTETARTADHAVKLAADDVKKQLERVVADLRGTDSYGIPSRRDPEHLRPANRTDNSGEDAELLVDETFDEGDEQNTDAWAMTPPS